MSRWVLIILLSTGDYFKTFEKNTGQIGFDSSLIFCSYKKKNNKLVFKSPTSYKIIPYPFKNPAVWKTSFASNMWRKHAEKQKQRIFLSTHGIFHTLRIIGPSKKRGLTLFRRVRDLETTRDLRSNCWFLEHLGTSRTSSEKKSNPGSGKRPKFRTISLRVDWIHFHQCNNDKIKAMLKTNPIKMMLAWRQRDGFSRPKKNGDGGKKTQRNSRLRLCWPKSPLRLTAIAKLLQKERIVFLCRDLSGVNLQLDN